MPTPQTDTVFALLSARQIVDAVLHAVRTGGPEAVRQVGLDIEPIIDPCALNNCGDGLWEGFNGWDDPQLDLPARRLTTCTDGSATILFAHP